MGRNNWSLLGVCDGHGIHGHFVSRFVKYNLPCKLISHKINFIRKHLFNAWKCPKFRIPVDFSKLSLNSQMSDCCFSSHLKATKNAEIQHVFLRNYLCCHAHHGGKVLYCKCRWLSGYYGEISGCETLKIWAAEHWS